MLKQPPETFFKKGVLKVFFQKDAPTQVFFCEYCNRRPKNSYFEENWEWLLL